MGRLLVTLGVQLASQTPGNVPIDAFVDGESFMKNTESIIRNLALRSNCVIVGRAAAIVLGTLEATLHVRIDGSRNARVVRGAKALNISIEESTKRLVETDRARSLYVKHFYGKDWADARLYHVVLDSTVISHEVCADIIIRAAADRFAEAGIIRNVADDPR